MALKKLCLGLCVTGLSLLAMPTYANVAANALILNNANLSYNDGGVAKTANASVTVAVDTVLCSPITVSAPADKTTPYTEVGGTGTGTAVYNYTFDACGNGPANYAIASTVTASSNTSVVPTANPNVTTVANVGASVTVAGSTQTVINVPSDGTADSVVNGISVGEFVVINTELRQVSAITDPGSNGVANITLASALVNAAPGIGVNIVEQASFSVTVNSGTILTAGVDVTATVDATVSSSAGTNTGVDTTVTTFASGNALMTKLVRNVTTATANSAGTNPVNYSVGGQVNTYYDGGVTGTTGDVLEYIVVVQNTGTGNVTDATVTNTIAVGLVQAVGNVQVIDAAGVTSAVLTNAAGDDAVEFTSPVLTVNIGSATGIANAAASGGTIAPTETYKVVYQATIR